MVGIQIPVGTLGFFSSLPVAPNVAVWWLALVLRILKVLGSSVGSATGYPV